jgi:hypothetical protein
MTDDERRFEVNVGQIWVPEFGYRHAEEMTPADYRAHAKWHLERASRAAERLQEHVLRATEGFIWAEGEARAAEEQAAELERALGGGSDA